MSVNQVLVSQHGRRFGISSSGGILSEDSTGSMQRAVMQSSADVIQGKPAQYLDTIEASGSKMTNYGLSHITSDVINGSTILISAPAQGVEKKIFLDSSASTLSIGTTAAGITFGASVGSSVYNMDAAGGVKGTGIVMVGLSATRWAFVGHQKLGD